MDKRGEALKIEKYVIFPGDRNIHRGAAEACFKGIIYIMTAIRTIIHEIKTKS